MAPTDARERYSALVGTYDRRTRRIQGWRDRAVDRLLLTPGQMVLDFPCGSGAGFPLINQYVGQKGRLVGVDASPDMLEVARSRIDRHGWSNVALVGMAVQDPRLPARLAELAPEGLDAAVCAFGHDVLQMPDALRAVLAAVRPGARVVAVGAKWAPPWAVPVNIVVRMRARPYVSTFRGFAQPWRHLEEIIGPMRVEISRSQAVYVATGTVPAGLNGNRG